MNADSAPIANAHQEASLWRTVLGIFKLRIGFVIALTALAGLAISPGPSPGAAQVVVLFGAVLLASASAGAFNQYYEADLDPLMARTRGRAFASGRVRRGPLWLLAILALLALAVGAAALAFNAWAALYVFLGAFFYGVVYTVWLKRRSAMNIVIGGLAGSWAVLAGAAASDPRIGAAPLALAWILFLWTPPHFWSLALVCNDDYVRARVPMLPVVLGPARAARVIFYSTLALSLSSLLPLLTDARLGWLYAVAALAGGGLFLHRARDLMRTPARAQALACFHASLWQLSLLLLAILLEAAR